MQKFIVSTDSSCDLSIEQAQKINVFPIFMTYTIDQDVFVDEMKVSELDGFYGKMRDGAVPKTGSTSIGDLKAHFEKLAEQKMPIVHIALGSAISGTYNNAVLARDMVIAENPDCELFVVDSTSASLGVGVLVLEAARMRDEGSTAEECVKFLESIRHGISPYFTTGDLTYLYRGGRVKKGSMIIAHALGIHPVLELDYPGALRVCDKCRGTKATYDKIIKKIRAKVISPSTQTLYVSHSNCPETAKEFAELIKKEIGFKDIFYSHIGTIIGAHTGPGLVAVFFHGKDRDI